VPECASVRDLYKPLSKTHLYTKTNFTIHSSIKKPRLIAMT